MPRSELNHSRIMPTFRAKSDENQIESDSIFMQARDRKKDLSFAACFAA